jgi:hypothetical protein
VKAGHAPQITNMLTKTYDVYGISFESEGVFEINNEYSGLAVTPAYLYSLLYNSSIAQQSKR